MIGGYFTENVKTAHFTEHVLGARQPKTALYLRLPTFMMLQGWGCRPHSQKEAEAQKGRVTSMGPHSLGRGRAGSPRP